MKKYHHHDNKQNMNNQMLSNLLKQRLVAAQMNPKGISIDSIPDTETSNTKNILVIPPGMSSSNVNF